MVEMGRSILKGMNMPSYFWGEAIRHSMYLLNRQPTRALYAKTPQQSWSGKKPNLKYVRVFGCTAYMKIPDVHMRKLDDRSKAVVNLGKEVGTKAYRLFDPNTKDLIVSRDVTFDEKKPWNWEAQNSGNLVTSTEFNIAGMFSNLDENAELEQESVVTPVHTQGIEFQQTHDESGEPRQLLLLSKEYDEMDEIEMDSELILLSIEEPCSYRQAVQEKE